ncbi:MAG: rnz [Chlamydiales bacterium]|jgi:ribonuclease Z|nr:rnz [Chlamydiales bacterium]
MTVRDLTILGCSSQQPTRFRNHGAYLLRWNLEGMLFDPGEGTQRQFIFANVAPPVVNRIFISHFHGDHCLGLGSMLMRLNLDHVTHPIHCYYPARYKKYFDRLRYGTVYHETIQVVEHPVAKEGLVEDDGKFKIEAAFLEHGVDNIAWRITESATRKFDKARLNQYGIRGPLIKKLEQEGHVTIGDQQISLEDVSWVRPGDTFAYVLDTKFCQNAIDIAKGADLLLAESTYLDEHKDLAHKHNHMTAKEAALVAKKAGVKKLILTHFSARYQNLKPFETEARQVFAETEIADDLRVFPFEKSASASPWESPVA